MNQADLRKWVDGCAKYLKDKALEDRLYNRPSSSSLDAHPSSYSCQKTYDEFVIDCEAAEKALKDAADKLNTLRKYYTQHKLMPFLSVEQKISNAATHATDAQSQIQLAILDLSIEHPQKTRALSLQKSAVIFADAAVGLTYPKKVRNLAKKIMQAAGLTEPDDKTISNWLNEIRKKENNK